MTDISKLGEFGLINRLTKDIKPKNDSTIYGVGDDCAVLNYPDTRVLTTTDMLMEGVHFDLTYITMQQLGYKAANRWRHHLFAHRSCHKHHLHRRSTGKGHRLSQRGFRDRHHLREW